MACVHLMLRDTYATHFLRPPPHTDLSQRHSDGSAVALLNGNTVWDMHRPLTESGTLQLLNFQIEDPHHVNRAFWRSCSFMLGAVLQHCIKDSAALQLHSFPGPQVRSGSFVHDIALAESAWQPTREELRAISAEMVKLAARRVHIERLEVQHDLALEMFRDNPYKREQLPSIAKSGSVVLYRCGQHVDISRGPMIGHTGLLGKCTVSAVHRITADTAEEGALYRVQGVALPAGVVINHVAYGILEERSRKLVGVWGEFGHGFRQILIRFCIVFFFRIPPVCPMSRSTSTLGRA